MKFSLLDLTMNDTYDFYELHPPHLINVATLRYESQNSENVILQWDITKENTIKYIVYALLKWTLDYKIWGVMQQCMYETKICDIICKNA